MTVQHVAVLIDAENVSVSAAARIVDEAARHGLVRERRLYGDFARGRILLPGLTPRRAMH